MAKITDKVKEKLKGAKDKVASTTKEGASTTKEKMTDAKDKVASTTKEGTSGVSSSTFCLLSLVVIIMFYAIALLYIINCPIYSTCLLHVN